LARAFYKQGGEAGTRDEGVRAFAASAARKPPDGGSYGSRWSRAQRETTGNTTRSDFPTAAAVAEKIHAACYLIRDPIRGREKRRRRDPGGLALRARPPATLRDAIRRPSRRSRGRSN